MKVQSIVRMGAASLVVLTVALGVWGQDAQISGDIDDPLFEPSPEERACASDIVGAARNALSRWGTSGDMGSVGVGSAFSGRDRFERLNVVYLRWGPGPPAAGEEFPEATSSEIKDVKTAHFLVKAADVHRCSDRTGGRDKIDEDNFCLRHNVAAEQRGCTLYYQITVNGIQRRISFGGPNQPMRTGGFPGCSLVQPWSSTSFDPSLDPVLDSMAKKGALFEKCPGSSLSLLNINKAGADR